MKGDPIHPVLLLPEKATLKKPRHISVNTISLLKLDKRNGP